MLINVHDANIVDWFKEATLFLDNYQKERLRELDKREEDEKGPIKEKLKAELDKLENLRNNSVCSHQNIK